MREQCGGRYGKESGREEAVKVPYIFATRSNVLDYTTAGLTIQLVILIDIIILGSFH